MSLQTDDAKTKDKKRPPTRENADEAAFMRQKASSLALHGDYRGCAKYIEDNISVMYNYERWPDRFFSVLRTYQRCYPSLNLAEPFEEHLSAILKKNRVPFVLASLLRGDNANIIWSADYFKDLAVLSESNKDYETALSYCDLALKIEPSSSGIYTVRGWVLDDMDKPDEAAKMYREAIEINGSSHGAYNSLAKHYADNDAQKALELVEKAIEISPAEGAYYDTKAKILLRLNDRDAAVACYDLAMYASPYVADYPYKKAELLSLEGKEMAAISMYKKAVALNGEHIPSLWRLAVLYKDIQPELALDYANLIAELEHRSKETLLLRAELLGASGDEKAAGDQYRELLEEDPRCHEAYGGLADMFVLKEPARAVEYYEKAISLSPKTAAYHMGKARAHENLDETSAAVKEYHTVISIDKNNARAYGRLASLLAATKPNEAVACYTSAISLMPENSYYHAAKGEILMGMPGRREEAIACFNQASAHDSKNAELHVYLAQLLEESGSTASAAEHYKQAIGLGVKNADAYCGLAKLILSSEPDMALLHINSAISLDDKKAEYYYFKAVILNMLENDEKALEKATKSLSESGRNPWALNELFGISSGKGSQSSMDYINRAIELEPNNENYLCVKADMLLRAEEFTKAHNQYQEALRLNHKNHRALFGFGRCLYLKRDPAALEYYEKAIAQYSGDAAYHAGKAELLADAGSFLKAVASYDEAIALEPESWVYMLAKAKALEASGQSFMAQECYEQAIARYPDCAEALGRLGILVLDENPKKSEECLNRAIEISPGSYIYRAWHGKALLALGMGELAAEEYKEAARLGGETDETHYTLALILRDKQPETALGYCLRALKMNDSNAGYHFLCGELYDSLGLEPAALGQFKEALRLDPQYHEAMEKIIDLQYQDEGADTLEAVDRALITKPDCVRCIMHKVRILEADAENDNTDEIIKCLDKAINADPDLIPARQRLVELLRKKRMFTRYLSENHRLKKLLAAKRFN